MYITVKCSSQVGWKHIVKFKVLLPKCVFARPCGPSVRPSRPSPCLLICGRVNEHEAMTSTRKRAGYQDQLHGRCADEGGE